MPVVKPIDGHTRCANIMRYLTKKQRVLAADYLNLDAPVAGHENGLPEYADFDWARAMDRTRERYGNDRPYNGKRARTYKHYVVSPDPADAVDLPALRELATAWAAKHFPNHQVAIVYHDDNENRIPHAHVVVNNTDLETGRRLQVPNPKSLNRSMQKMALSRGLRAFDNAPPGARHPAEHAPAGRPVPGTRRRTKPRTLQKVHRSRAEEELARRGGYSWVADIRARVDIARATAATEADFRETLSRLGVLVTDNSPKARRPDWIYALADAPARRVSGEKLGLLYGKAAMQRRFAYAPPDMADADRETIARIARDAIGLANLDDLQSLAGAVTLVDRKRIRSTEALDRAIARGEVSPDDPAAAAVRSFGFLPARARHAPPGARHHAAHHPSTATNHNVPPGAWHQAAHQQTFQPPDRKGNSR